MLGTPPENLDVVALPVADNPLVVIARNDHPLMKAKSVTLKRLAEEPFILREPGSGTRLAVEKHFADHGLKVRVRMELGSNEAIKQAIAGGLGISILSSHTLALEGDQGLLQPLNVKGFPLLRQWYVAYPAGKHLSAVAEAFLGELLGRATPR